MSSSMIEVQVRFSRLRKLCQCAKAEANGRIEGLSVPGKLKVFEARRAKRLLFTENSHTAKGWHAFDGEKHLRDDRGATEE